MTGGGVLLVGFGVFWLRKRIDARKRIGHNDLQAPLLDSKRRSASALEMCSGGSQLSKLLDERERQSMAIDFYDIEYHSNDIIGHGAQGRVYKARYMGMHVALKELVFGGMASNKEARDLSYALLFERLTYSLVCITRCFATDGCVEELILLLSCHRVVQLLP